jgi:ribosomal protein S18 acetylase RimI-like enzyme
MEVALAQIEDLEEVSKLFDQYRVFYNQSSDIDAARLFLQNRLQHGDSKIFVARTDQRIVGFTQLYPSFSSVSMKTVWILNDLFVEKSSRNKGVAKSLIGTAENFGRATNAVRIILSTQVANITAQSLYESLGYSKNEDFYHYALQL